MQCMQVVIVFYGAKHPGYFSFEKEDGFKNLRYVSLIAQITQYQGYIILDHVSYFFLVLCTIYEPVFIRKAKRFYYRRLKSQRSKR